MKDIYQVIDTILVSEKATLLQEENNEYVFKVHCDANKLSIKRAIEQLFGKKVETVRTLNVQGKKKRTRRADAGRTAHWKKAIGRLKDGETLELV